MDKSLLRLYKHEAETAVVLLDRCLLTLRAVAAFELDQGPIKQLVHQTLSLLDAVHNEDDPVKVDLAILNAGLPLFKHTRL